MTDRTPHAEHRAPWYPWRLVVVGLVGGVFSGLFGVGGGILMVPLLLTLARMDQRQAAATSLVAIVPTALVGTTTYGLQGELDLAVGALLAAGGMVGAPLGARALRRLPLRALRWSFIGLLVVVATQLVVTVPDRGAELAVTPWSAVALVAVGVLVGVTAGLFGIGGGLITVPALMVGFGVGDLLAKGTSLLAIIPTAAAGTWSNLRARLVDLRAGALVGLVAAVSSFGGVALAFWVPPRLSGALFAVLVLGAATQLTVRTLRGR